MRPLRRLLLAAALLPLAACSGVAHLHPPRALPSGETSAAVNALVPIDFALRVGLGDGWDAGLRFSLPARGFTEVELHADVQRDLDPGGDGGTVALGLGAGVSTTFGEFVFREPEGTALVLQPYAAYGNRRDYVAARPAFGRVLGAEGWRFEPIWTVGTLRGGDGWWLAPELSLLGRTPAAALGVGYATAERD